jgi:hypothetical protein
MFEHLTYKDRMEDDDGFGLYETRVICRYNADQGTKLIPDANADDHTLRASSFCGMLPVRSMQRFHKVRPSQ